MDLLSHLGDAGSIEAGEAYTGLGGLLQIQGLFSEAEVSHKKTVGLLTQHAGAESWPTAKALNRLGRLYMEWGRFSEASSILRKARAIAEKSAPEDNPQLITLFDSEAYLLCQSGKFKEAEKKWGRIEDR